jgi:hypothetical protein
MIVLLLYGPATVDTRYIFILLKSYYLRIYLILCKWSFNSRKAFRLNVNKGKMLYLATSQR